MARIAGVDIPRNKHVQVALTYIYGIGPTTAAKVLKEANVEGTTRVQQLTEGEVARIRSVIENPAADLLELDSGALVPLTFVTEQRDDVTVIDPPAGLFDL